MSASLPLPPHPRGFTLLEAIVALTIFGMAALALYGWLGTNMIALGRVEATHSALADARTALEVVETVNPLLEPEGERELPGLTVRWTSRPLVERRSGKGPSGAITIFDLALFEMEVETWREGRRTWHFTLRRAGWEAVREVMPEDL